MDISGIRWEIFVTDLARSANFYEQLGFAVIRLEDDYVSVSNGTSTIGIALNAQLPNGHPLKRPGNEAPHGVEFVLEVADIEETFRELLRNRMPINEEIADRPWGLRDFRVIDPDGYYLRFTNI